MDELEKRRRQLADPEQHVQSFGETPVNELSQKQIEALKSSQVFEGLLYQSMAVDIPEQAAEKVILNHRLSKKKNYFTNWAIAASVMFASILSITLFNNKQLSIADEALVHVYDEIDHLFESNVIATEVVKQRLAKSGFSLPSLPGEITYASKCGFRGNKAMHLVAEIEGQPVTILITPLQVEDNEKFGDKRFAGKMRRLAKGNVIVIAEKTSLIDKVYKQITHV